MSLRAECEDLERFGQRVAAGVRIGDESLLRAFVERYRALLAHVERHDRATIDRDTADAIRRLVALDRRLITLVQVRLTEIRRSLATLSDLRQTLTAYRGGPPLRGVYTERLA